MPTTEKQFAPRETPLRLPGQSLDEKIEEKRDQFTDYVLLAGFTVSVAFMEWYRELVDSGNSPWTFTIIAIIAITYAGFKFKRFRQEIRCLKQGRLGERIVAELVDELRSKGYRTLHDVVGGNFNVDHVVIGPAGIFAIETKAWSKTKNAQNKIEVDGSHIILNGYKVTPNPLDQAKAGAAWLREILHRSTTKSFRVSPVLLFPEWWVELKTKPREALVLNPKQFGPTLESMPVILSDEEIAQASFYLEQFVRVRNAAAAGLKT